jgi:hypothetical protein
LQGTVCRGSPKIPGGRAAGIEKTDLIVYLTPISPAYILFEVVVEALNPIILIVFPIVSGVAQEEQTLFHGILRDCRKSCKAFLSAD